MAHTPLEMPPAVAEFLREQADAAVPTCTQMVARTGMHPIAEGRSTRGAHMAPWTPERVWLDANDGLACIASTGRRVDRDYLGGAMPLLPAEVEAAAYTVALLERDGMGR